MLFLGWQSLIQISASCSRFFNLGFPCLLGLSPSSPYLALSLCYHHRSCTRLRHQSLYPFSSWCLMYLTYHCTWQRYSGSFWNRAESTALSSQCNKTACCCHAVLFWPSALARWKDLWLSEALPVAYILSLLLIGTWPPCVCHLPGSQSRVA